MKNKTEKTIVTFKDGKNNMLIVSGRYPGESKSEHKDRIEFMKKIMITHSRHGK